MSNLCLIVAACHFFVSDCSLDRKENNAVAAFEVTIAMLEEKANKADQRRLRTELQPSSKMVVEGLHERHQTPPLIEAVRAGDLERVNLLVASGEDINEVYTPPGEKSKYNALFYALQSPEILKFLLDAGANPNIKLTGRKTPLHFSAGSRALEALCILLDKGADINAKDLHGKTPLHYNCFAKSKVTYELLKRGADIQIADDQGLKPVHLAYRECDIELLQEFMKRGASLNEFIPGWVSGGGLNALHCAFYFGAGKPNCLELARWLIDEQKMNVNEFCRWPDGQTGGWATPIMLALAQQDGCHEDDFEVLNFLLDRGADLNVVCHMNGSPNWRGVLDWGKQQAKLPHYIIEWLIHCGAR